MAPTARDKNRIASSGETHSWGHVNKTFVNEEGHGSPYPPSSSPPNAAAAAATVQSESIEIISTNHVTRGTSLPSMGAIKGSSSSSPEETDKDCQHPSPEISRSKCAIYMRQRSQTDAVCQRDVPESINEKNLKSLQEKVPKAGGTGENKPIVYTQILGALITALTNVTVGAIIGLPAVTLPQLTDPDSSDIFLNTTQVGLFSSIVHLGAIVGSTVAGGLNLCLGQRVTLLLTLPLTLSMWLVLAVSPTVWMVLLVRALLGAMLGFIAAASPNYVVEIADRDHRGKLCGLVDICRQSGFLLVYIVGSFNLTWRQITIICGCVTSIPPFIGLYFLPNSPRWLVTRGRIEEAEKALVFYRGSHHDVKPELTAVIDQFEKTTSKKIAIMLEPSVYPRFFLVAFLMIGVHCTGNTAIATFIVQIFQATNADVNPYTSAILVGSERVAGTIAFLIMIDQLGRRTAFIVSCIACAISLAVLGAYFFLLNRGDDVSTISWLPLGSLIFYTPFGSTIQIITGLLHGELLPTALRALGAPIMYTVYSTGLFALTQAFPEMVETTGEEGTFWIFAGFCVLLAGVVTLALPETKGLSLEEIDDLFRNRKQDHLPKLTNHEEKNP